MSDWNPQTVWNVVIGGTNLLVLLGLILLFWRQRTPRPNTGTMTSTGTFCGHCGKRLKSDPAMAVAVANVSYFVYKCPACKGDTLLPTQSVG